jgi:hypothetical protein
MVCSILGCANNRAARSKGVKFFRIPGGKNDDERRRAWLKAINRGTTQTGRVCEVSCYVHLTGT